MYGMRFSDLTEERLKEILLLYEKIAGGNVKQYAFSKASQSMSIRLQYIRENLSCGLRFGSTLNGVEDNAKLFFWNERSIYDDKTNSRIDTLIKISFDSNAISGPEAEKIKENFEKAVDKLLMEWKVQIQL